MALFDDIMGGLMASKPSAPAAAQQQPQQPGGLNMVRPSLEMNEDVRSSLEDRLLGRYFGDENVEGSLAQLKKNRDDQVRKLADQLAGYEPVSEAEKFMTLGSAMKQRILRNGGGKFSQSISNVAQAMAPLAEKESRLKQEYKTKAAQLLADQATKDYADELNQARDYSKMLLQEQIKSKLGGNAGTLEQEIRTLSQAYNIGPNDPRWPQLVRAAWLGLRGTPENKLRGFGDQGAIELKTNAEYLKAEKEINDLFNLPEVRGSYAPGAEGTILWNQAKQAMKDALKERFLRLTTPELGVLSNFESRPQGQPQAQPAAAPAPEVSGASVANGFNKAVTNVLGREGGYTPKDGRSGAPANFGINQRANPDIDVKNMTEDQAKQLYKTRYWDAIGAEKLSQPAQEIAFDAAVNQGQDYAKKLIESTGGDPQKMINQRRQDYIKIVEANPAQVSEFKGWMDRLDDVAQKAGVKSPTGQLPEELPLGQRQEPTTTIKAPKVSVAPTMEPRITPAEEEKAKEKAKYEAKREFTMGGLGASIDRARQIMAKGVAVESDIGQMARRTGRAFKMTTEAGEDAAALEVIGGSLVTMMPRMEGPQSDLDADLYRKMAGKVGDSTISLNERLAALKEVERLWRKWDKSPEAQNYKPWKPGQPTTRPAAPANKAVKDQFSIIQNN